MVADVLSYFGYIIMFSTFLALAVSVFMFVRTKGTIDGLRDIGEVNRNLAESYKATLEKVQADQLDCRKKIEELQHKLEVEERAVERLIEGFTKYGVCIYAGSDECPHFKAV